jgi:hypothetical protein
MLSNGILLIKIALKQKSLIYQYLTVKNRSLLNKVIFLLLKYKFCLLCMGEYNQQFTNFSFVDV